MEVGEASMQRDKPGNLDVGESCTWGEYGRMDEGEEAWGRLDLRCGEGVEA